MKKAGCVFWLERGLEIAARGRGDERKLVVFRVSAVNVRVSPLHLWHCRNKASRKALIPAVDELGPDKVLLVSKWVEDDTVRVYYAYDAEMHVLAYRLGQAGQAYSPLMIRV